MLIRLQHTTKKDAPRGKSGYLTGKILAFVYRKDHILTGSLSEETGEYFPIVPKTGPDAIKEGLIAFHIAAHIGDTVKYGMNTPDRLVAIQRAIFDRDGQIRCALDRERAREIAEGTGNVRCAGNFTRLKFCGSSEFRN